MARVLNSAYADGRLNFEEHDERISKAYNAKTFGELDSLTEDLIPGGSQLPPALAELPQPSPVHYQQHLPAAPRVHAVPAAADQFNGGKAIMSSFRPDKGLIMPPYSELMAIMGDVRIDLVDATFTQREITIKVIAFMGEIRIRIPEGVKVISDVTNVMAEFKAEGAMPRRDGVVLRIEGTSIMGDVRVLGPDVKRPRKYEKFV